MKMVNAPNTACTGRLGLCAFFGDCSELWQFSVFELFPLPAAGNASRWAVPLIPETELLYEHDENGNQISGTIERLIEAAGKAYPIKVKIYQAKNHFDMMDAQWVFVEKNLVHASNTDQISLSRDSSGNYVFQEDAYHYYVVVNSEGHHHASRLYIDGRKRNTTDSKRRMAWFGLVPSSS